MMTLEKAGAVVIRGGLLLLCRKQGTDTFISPGGKLEPGETHLHALKRELREETGLVVRRAVPHSTHVAPAVFEKGTSVRLHAFIVDADGLATPSGEIEEIAWVDAGAIDGDMAIGSVFKTQILPSLRDAGLLRIPQRRSHTSEAMVVADLDGTLAFHKSGIGPEVESALRALEDSSNIRLVIATSRAPRGAKALLGERANRIDLLCCNGALHMSKGKVVARRAIAYDVASSIIRHAHDAHIPFYVEYGDAFYVSDPNVAPWMDYPDRQTLALPVLPDGVIKICVIAEHGLDLSEVTDLAQVNVCRHEGGTIDITAANATKDRAVIDLLGDLNHRIVAFGNDLNDQMLLSVADQAILVGDSLLGLEQASHVARIRANDRDVASALLKLV